MVKQASQVYRCRCETCTAGKDQRVSQAHEHINLLLTCLDEQQRRWYVATLAEQYGLRKGGVRIMVSGYRDEREDDTQRGEGIERWA